MSDYISDWNEYPVTMINIYPLTVVKDRYTGTYSGGEFTAWNLEPNEVPEEIQDEDVPCACFWRGEKEVLAGRGRTAHEATKDLCRRLNEAHKTENPSATESDPGKKVIRAEDIYATPDYWIKGSFWSEGYGMSEVYGYWWQCPKCGKSVKGGYTESEYPYCPHCGSHNS